LLIFSTNIVKKIPVVVLLLPQHKYGKNTYLL